MKNIQLKSQFIALMMADYWGGYFAYNVERIIDEIEQFYNAEIAARDKRIAELENPWIKCSERLPYNGEEVLLRVGKVNLIAKYYSRTTTFIECRHFKVSNKTIYFVDENPDLVWQRIVPPEG